MKNRVMGLKVAAWAGLLVGLTGVAQAQPECASDTDCDLGFSCEVVGASAGCAVAPCMEGSDCPVEDCLVAEEIMGCVPARDCQSDANCAEGYLCHTEQSRSCNMTMEACPPDTPCTLPKPADEPPCEVTEQSACVPRWQLPCTADADCGNGFACVEQQMCWCSGAAPDARPAMEPDPNGTLPMPPADGGVDDLGLIADPDCGCEGSGTFYCELLETECGSDSDCEAGMLCLPDPNGAACGDSAMSGEADGGGSDLEPGADLLPVQEPAMDAGVEAGQEPTATCPAPRTLCMPPDYGHSVALDSPRAGGDDGSATGAPVPSADPKGTEAPAEPEASGDAVADLNAPGTPSGRAGHLGCSVHGGIAGASQLGLIGLCLLGLRRRRRL